MATLKKPTKSPSKTEEKRPSPQMIHEDPLLDCLETMSQLLDRPLSVAAFKAGLPLENGKLTPALFIRASARAGLSAKISSKKIEDISTLTLPCILLLNEQKACILIDIKKDKVTVIFPEYGHGTQEIPLRDLQASYSGKVIFVRPSFRYDQRWKESHKLYETHWFWGALSLFWPLYTQVAIASILINLFTLASTLFALNVYDRVVPNEAFDTLWVLSIGVLVIYIFDLLLKIIRGYFLDVAGHNSDILISSRLFEHVMNLKMSSRPLSSGGFATALKEFEGLRDFFSSSTMTMIIDLPFGVLFLFVIFWIGGALGWIPTLGAAFVILVGLFFQAPINISMSRSFREMMQKQGLLMESLHGLETIKILNAEGKFQKMWEDLVSRSSDSSNETKLYSSISLNLTLFVQNIAYVFMVIYGVYLISQREMTMGGLIACSILLSRAMMPLTQVISLMSRWGQSKISLIKLNEIINLPVEREKGSHFVHRPIFKGEIEFKGVNFHYPQQEIWALQNINFRIASREKVAFVGKIGSGKTTIEKLILGLYTPTEGAVLLDGTDVRQIDPADIRANIGHVPQDVFHFFGTIKDNISMGAPIADDAALLRAAMLSGADDFVRLHPLGYDMPVGEEGRFLSGGQRQSIAIARALITDMPILLLDEPTAMMDPSAEANLLQRLHPLVLDKTLLLITHRTSLLALVDRIIVMDQGRIVADGPRDQVLQALAQSVKAPEASS